jgi:hypothetical protein
MSPIYIGRSDTSHPLRLNLSVVTIPNSERSHHEVVQHPSTGLGLELFSRNTACLWSMSSSSSFLDTIQTFSADSITDKLCCPSDQEDRMCSERQPMHLQLRALCGLSAILLLQEVQCQ